MASETKVRTMSEHQKSPFLPKISVELEANHEMRHRRERLLEASANATSILLTVENFDEAINTALQIIVEGAGCDRINVLEGNFDPLSNPASSLPTYHTAIYEWTRPGIMRQMDCLKAGRIPSVGIEAFLERHYLNGDGFGGLLADWVEPLRSFYASVQVQSSYSVPIRVKGQWWGVLCLNYCRAAIEIGAAEVAVLRSIADCIGSAIQRDRTQKILLQTEQLRVAELAKANHVLKQTVDLLATEPDLNRFLDYVLKAFAEQFDAPLIQYWERPEPGDIAYLRLACSNGKILTAAELPNDCLVTGVPIPPELAGYENFQTRQRYYVIEDIPTDPIELALFSPLNFDLEVWCTEHGIRKMINIALMWSEKPTSSLILYFPSGRHLSEQQIELMCALAQQVTLAIQLTQLAEIKQSEAIARAQEQTAQESVAELVKANTALKQSLDTLATDPDLDRFIGYTLELIAEQLDAPRIEYWVNPDQEDLVYSYLTYWQGQILKSSDPSARVGLDVTPFLDIPLKVGNTNIGTLAIYLPSYRTFAGQTIELAHALAQQLTFAIELTRLAEEAQQAALLQERTQMAREIHDTLAQAFGGISMQLQAFDYFATTQPEKAQTHLLTAQALAQDGLAEARRSVWTLHLETSEYADPARTIAKFIEQTMSRQSVPIDFLIDGSPVRLHPDLGLNLLRIAQESIANALRHAQPHTIQIRLSYSPQNLQMTVCDDGCGFESQSSSPGFGLMGMQQRAARIGATWQLVSQIDRGTSITITLTHPEAS
jgi:signal transduction histidine kinase